MGSAPCQLVIPSEAEGSDRSDARAVGSLDSGLASARLAQGNTEGVEAASPQFYLASASAG